MLLDIGCGPKKMVGYTGMDMDMYEGVDIMHNIESIPWPIEDNCCTHVNASHVLEHVSPTKIIEVMNELWRITAEKCEVEIRTPYGDFYHFDPTHQIEFYAPSWMYFDHTSEYYDIYRPKPWKLMKAEVNEKNMELHVILRRCKIEQKKEKDNGIPEKVIQKP